MRFTLLFLAIVAVGCGKNESPNASKGSPMPAIQNEQAAVDNPDKEADNKPQPEKEDDKLAKRLAVVTELTLRVPSIVNPDDYYPFNGSEDYPAYHEFDNRLWVPVGYCRQHGVSGFIPLMYSAGNKNERLVLLPDNKKKESEQEPFDVVYFASIQKINNGKWINEGLQETRFRDGERKIHTYRLGKLDGLTKLYYTNGQLQSSIEYKNDARNGRFLGWYSSGKPFHDCMYVNDKEISGTYWNEDGSVK